MEKIKTYTDPDSWAFCPGKQNPVDLLTRGTSAHLSSKDLWWRGPEWLTKDEMYWPSYIPMKEFNSAELEEKRIKKVSRQLGVNVIDQENYRSATRLYRVTA